MQCNLLLAKHAGQDFYIDLDVTLVMDRRSTLDKKVAVLPLLCAAALLLATFWTHPADTARLRLNSAVCTILVITLLALSSVEWDNTWSFKRRFHNHEEGPY